MNRKKCDCPGESPAIVPRSVVNGAGAAALACRVGTQASFVEGLKRRLSSPCYPQLAKLRARQVSDPAIALLDAWCVAADVLTFYNERIINEGYLRTATETQSLVELSKLIGHRPGPGVAASVFLAFTAEKDPKEKESETVIPAGTACKSVPCDDEPPQTFETALDLTARMEWSAIKPRQVIPQKIASGDIANVDRLFLKGVDLNLKPNDRVLVMAENQSTDRTIRTVTVDAVAKRTEIVFDESAFSVSKLQREVLAAINSVISNAEPASQFDWMQTTVLGPTKKLRDGTSGTGGDPAIEDWKELSEYDNRLSDWAKGIGESAAPKALNELGSQGSPYDTFVTTLTKDIEEGCATTLDGGLALSSELLTLDEKAQAFYLIVKDCDVDTPADIAAAKTALKDEVLPIAGKMTLHFAKLKTLSDAVTNLDAAPSPATKTAFTDARADLKTWWGLTAGGGLNSNARKFDDAFGKLRDDLQPLVAGQVDVLKAIEAALTTINGISVSTSIGPKQDRKDELLATVSAPLTAYVAALNALVAPTQLPVPPPSTAPLSTILTELSSYIATSVVTPIKNEKDRPKKHVLATTTLGELQKSVIASRETARALIKIAMSLDVRRGLFAAKAKQIAGRYASLKDSPFVSVRDCWSVIDKTLQDAQASGKSPYATQLNVTMDAIGGDDKGHIRSLLNLAGTGDESTSLTLAALLRELRGLIALNGGGGSAPPPPTQPSTNAAGIGEIISPSGDAPSAGASIVIRVVKDVLEVPNNTASDVVAQLAESFGMISPADMRARWLAVTNGKQESAAALLSQPLNLFGYNAPRPLFLDIKTINQKPPEWLPVDDREFVGGLFVATELPSLIGPTDIFLQFKDAEVSHRIRESRIVSRSNYGLNAKTTQCIFAVSGEGWLPSSTPANTEAAFELLRTTLALVPIKTLELDESPLPTLIGKNAKSDPQLANKFEAETDQIELDDLYLGLEAGRWITIQGERSDAEGVIVKEVRRIVFVRHILRDLPGDKVHTRIFLSAPLEFTYKRDTVTINANVVLATHGETTRQVLGSGDASQAFQQFALARTPLTHLAAPTPNGVQSTLALRVNDLLWHEQDSLLDSDGASRDFMLQIDEKARAIVQFGDGRSGARLPTGRENVRADYRVGLGAAGNVRAGQITQLAHAPRGIKEVTNRLPAAGGADADTVEQLRANAPLAVMALDRLVSVRDYADFARNFAGIEKATARRLSAGGQSAVHVTIAGANDMTIARDSDLYFNLRSAYKQLGDPAQGVQLLPREFLILFISAGIRLAKDYEWSAVARDIRAALFDTFGFARRELAENVYLSQVQAAIQGVAGVEYVDVDIFNAISARDFRDALDTPAPGGPSSAAAAQPGGETETKLQSLFKALRNPPAVPAPVVKVEGPRVDRTSGTDVIRPAQIAYLSPDVTDSLFLREIPR